MTVKNNETALITGASSGIGAELSHQFAADGIDVVLVARSKAKLEKLADDLQREYAIKAHVIARDLSVETAPEEIYDELKGQGITIDYLVNNAGFGNFGPFIDQNLDNELDMLRVNVLALTALTRLFLPSMIEKGRGHILNLASVASFMPGGPGMAAYFASKAFVLPFSTALSAELRGTGVKVTALCPGPTKTDFDYSGDLSKTLLFTHNLSTAKKVAAQGYRAMKRGQRTFVPGLVNKILAVAGVLPPRGIPLAITGFLLKPR